MSFNKVGQKSVLHRVATRWIIHYKLDRSLIAMVQCAHIIQTFIKVLINHLKGIVRKEN